MPTWDSPELAASFRYEAQERSASLRDGLLVLERSAQVRQACATHGGFYLGSIGGPAAILAQDASVLRSGLPSGIEVIEHEVLDPIRI